MIQASALIAKFQYALDHNWGYIMGKAGEEWTAAKQAKVTDANAKEYGAKWIGHMVADCSGLFYWAFKQLGGYMYHGSNTMWNKYCVNQGSLSNGKRTDGKELKPGTAVFVYKPEKQNRSHVGLYVGNGIVIEAMGTQNGVTTTKITNKKWVEWGELKGVSFSEQKDEVIIVIGYAKVSTASGSLNLRTSKSTKADVIAQIPKDAQVQVLEKGDEWCKIVYESNTGYAMTKFLSFSDGEDSSGKISNLMISIPRDCANALYEALKFSLKK